MAEDQKALPENPSAYPMNGPYVETQHGMTLLDHFASEAMGSLITAMGGAMGPGVEVKFKYDEMAKGAYNMAEAMLRERADRIKKYAKPIRMPAPR